MLWSAHDLGLNRPVVEQTAYHLLDRRAERDLVPAALTHDTALSVWSPLAGGLLTGKYLGQPAGNARLSPTDAWGAKHFTPQADAAVARLADCARPGRRHPDGAQPGLDVAAPRDHQRRPRAPINLDQLAEQLAALDTRVESEQLERSTRSCRPAASPCRTTSTTASPTSGPTPTGGSRKDHDSRR